MLTQKSIGIIKSTVPVLKKDGEKITTRFYQLMFQAHPDLLNIFNHANQKQGRQQRALANAVYLAAQHIDHLDRILPEVHQIAQKHRSLGVKPEHYPIVGEYLLLAIKDVLGEAATDEILMSWKEAYHVIADAFINIEANMYAKTFSQKGGWIGFRPFVVEHKIAESDTITSFYLKPEDKKEFAGFIPGQYISIKLEMEGENFTHIRQYSLSDAPGKGYYRISVKRETGTGGPVGKVSTFLHDRVKEGDVLQLSAPAGEFVLDLKKASPVVLLSAGAGVTPIMSMLNTLIRDQPERKVTFVHAAQNSHFHAFKDSMEKITKLKNVNSIVVYTSPTDEDRIKKQFDFEGYITAEWLKENVAFTDTDFYFCGPFPFMKTINLALKQLNIDQSRIHFEFFGPKGSLENN